MVGAAGSNQTPKVSTPKLIFDANVGNLIVGDTATNDSAALAVRRANASNGALTYSLAWFQNATGYENGLAIKATDNAVTLAADYAGAAGGAAAFIFATNSTTSPNSATERARISSSGNLGVGTTAPGARVDIFAATPASDTALRIKSNTAFLSPDGSYTITARMLNTDVLSFSGSTGQLFSIADTMTGSIFAVNDISGIPSIEVFDTGQVRIAELSGNVLIGTATDSTSNKLQVVGNAYISGNVGVGTTSPSGKLHVSGGQLRITADASNEQLYINRESNTNEALVLGFHSSDYGWIQAVEQGVAYRPLVLNRDGGNVGIGTTAPGYKLDVSGSLRSTAVALLGTSVGQGDPNSTDITANATLLLSGVGGNYLAFGQKASNLCQWIQSAYANPTTAIYPISLNPLGGNVGVGTITPGYLLTVYAAGAPQLALNNATRDFVLTNNAGDSLLSFNYGGANRLQFDTANQWINSGNLGIGFSPGTNPIVKVDILDVARSGSNTVSGTVFYATSSVNDVQYIGQFRHQNQSQGIGFSYNSIRQTGSNTNEQINLCSRGTGNLNLRYASTDSSVGTIGLTLQGSDGNVGVGTTAPAYKLEVNGSFAATTKSFVIDHPTKPGHKLRYGSLEGPENGVYVRGRLQRNYRIELPEYWTKLVDPDSITVQLIPRGRYQRLYVESIRDNAIYIDIEGSWAGSIDCDYIVYAERRDVPKLEVEIDGNSV